LFHCVETIAIRVFRYVSLESGYRRITL